MEEGNQALQSTMDPSSSSSLLERRPSGEEDPAAMTIEFLRARLLSERSVSKAARERSQQLAKKVSELEERLEVEIQLRKKIEADRLEILLKYKAELSEEYGDFFASSLGERDESALDSPNSRKHDNNEEFVSYTPNEDGEGLPHSRLEQFDRSDSSQQFSREDANDEDDETDHSGREKGVLSWGKRKGSKKEFGHGTDWLGRNFSQRSLTSTDGESPQKKWAGKSVRQIRKRESRSNDTNEGENGETQAPEDGDSEQPATLQERLPCEDERDTEVERVLEQQAELIEQYEAEENAQRAWEAKFKEGKALSNYENVISPSKTEGKLEGMISTHTVEEGFINKDEAANPAATESSLPNEIVIRHSRKVHPEDIPKGTQEGLIESESIQKNNLQDTDEPIVPFESKATSSNVDQVGVGKSDREPFRAEKGTEGVKSLEVLNGDSLQCQVSSNVGAEQSTEQSIGLTVELGKRSKYKKHLSSSFRFAVFPEAEPIAGSSPQMHGFTTYKQDEDRTEESDEVNGSRGGSGLPDSHPHDSEGPVASLDSQVNANGSPAMGDCPITREDAESQEREEGMLKEDILEREKPLRHSSENRIMDPSPNAGSSNNLTSHSFKEDENTRMKGLEREQDLPPVQGRHVPEAPFYKGGRGPGSSEYPQQQHYSNFPPPSDYGSQPLKDLDGANFDNLALYSGGSHGPGLHAVAHEETAYRGHRRSLDGFDRVADVLRVLQIAKFQVQSSPEQDVPSIGERNGYDGSDAFYTEPPRLPSIYAAPPQPYAVSAPYSSRGAAPYIHNMHGWGAVSAGYGVGSSRQVANAPYMNYLSRVPETQNMLPPPLSGVQNNVYHYDTRQHK
ncbi:hypothetical protein GOP47_0014573 [Adiantum capillus-veneris]|uniref:Uncharacterized protein n=1 Tax=Adiantum capillus-veneris TaxID=13818 RepID=A0A9D4ULR0_ADICA|nr:hypothetical protein GOP47_0014573 [Adiantum capillus-veneris]